MLYQLDLPWPPSVNHYYRHVPNMRKPLISREGRAYHAKVAAIVAQSGMPTLRRRLGVTVECFPPDNRRRDLDNLSKALLDSLQNGGAYEDDKLIDYLLFKRSRVEKPDGLVRVTIFDLARHRRCPECGKGGWSK